MTSGGTVVLPSGFFTGRTLTGSHSTGTCIWKQMIVDAIAMHYKPELQRIFLSRLVISPDQYHHPRSWLLDEPDKHKISKRDYFKCYFFTSVLLHLFGSTAISLLLMCLPSAVVWERQVALNRAQVERNIILSGSCSCP